MTVQVDTLGPLTEDYRSPTFTATVNGDAAYVYSHTRDTVFAVPGWWDEEEEIEVAFFNFGTDQETVVTISTGDETIDSVEIYPRAYGIEATIVDNTVTFTLLPRQKVWVGFNGVNAMVVHVFANALTTTPTGTEYNGTQLSATGTLIFPRGVHDLVNAGAWSDIGFPVMSDATVYLAPGAVVIGNFDINGGGATHQEDILIYGPGILSGEYTTWEAVYPLDFFATQAHASIAGFESATLPHGIEVRDITILASPFVHMGITVVNYAHDVKMLAPWTPNTDGVVVHKDVEADAPGAASHCYVWSGDDGFVTSHYVQDVEVDEVFLCSSGNAAINLGYQQNFEFPTGPTTLRTIYVRTCSDYYVNEPFEGFPNGAEGGAIIQGWIDAPAGTSDRRGMSDVTIDGLYIDGAAMNTMLFNIGNRLYPWGAANDGFGQLSNVTIRNVVTEAAPTDISKLLGLDAANTSNGIVLENIVTGGVRWSVRNAASYMTWPDSAFNVTIDGASLVS